MVVWETTESSRLLSLQPLPTFHTDKEVISFSWHTQGWSLQRVEICLAMKPTSWRLFSLILRY